MEYFIEHWLSVGTAVFLLAMILYGHYRGFLKIAVSMSALILSLVIVRLAAPYVTGFIRQNTAVQQVMERGLLNLAGLDDDLSGLRKDNRAELEHPSGQRGIIEHLRLPEQMKEALIENNNNEVYKLLGVDAFFDYIAAYLANMVLNIIGSVLLFILVYAGLRLMIRWLDVIARLPVLSGMNQIAGAVLGGVQGLLILWVLCLLVKACAGTGWGQMVIAQIGKSPWLLFLYENNLFNWLLAELLKNCCGSAANAFLRSGYYVKSR